MPASSLTITNFGFPSHNHVNKTPLKLSQITAQNTFRSHILKLQQQQPVEKLHIPSKPASKSSLFTVLSPTQKKLTKSLVEKTATILLGSLIFMGSLKSRPVLAQPVQQTQTFEQQKNAQFGSSSSSGDNEEEVMCVKLLEQNPKSIEALKRVVNVKMRRGKTNEAVEYVEKLIEVQPNEMEWRLLQALCYEMMGNLSKAKSLFKNILKQRPLLLRALHGLAMVMHKNHEGPAVFEMLERALEIAHREKRVNEERNIRILVAQMHIVKGDLEEALEKFRDLVDENPRDFRPYLCQGIVYSLLEKSKEAEESFAIYRSLVPEEFPQRGFLDDVVLAAKSESKQQLEKELQS
ncbi:hypothetical protein BUALT_Bualt19G0055400 [Buddleja alternifolia]|uniref:Uncharacterized protein n=1 Tax=Buddleja alternifolia TaxID=168488 RepID=A0AAV6W1V2_9LAMI|nr:hypothetical protein BUALT_Bualt19G0055400 [Buddleja alternifolia]